MARLMSREAREAELRELASKPIVGFQLVAPILQQHQGAHLRVPSTTEEIIRAILDIEFPRS